MNFKDSSEQELQHFECYRPIKSKENFYDTEINLSQSINNINDNFLYKYTKKAKGITLILKGVLAIPPNSSSQIIKYISPKLKKIIIHDCNLLNWSDVKSILASAESIEEIDLRRNLWVNDYVIEQLSLKFSKSLKVLKLEKSDLSDNSLFHVGKRCLKLRDVTFDCCHKVFFSSSFNLCFNSYLIFAIIYIIIIIIIIIILIN
jgi:hypothetical protein